MGGNGSNGDDDLGADGNEVVGEDLPVVILEERGEVPSSDPNLAQIKQNYAAITVSQPDL